MAADLTRREAMTRFGAMAALPGLTVPGLAAPAPPDLGAPAPPDLANLHGLMGWLARENAPRRSFLDARFRSIEDWKREARPVYLSHLRYEPRARPLGADLVAREERDGFVVETVRIHATEAYDIPAWVLVPSGESSGVADRRVSGGTGPPSRSKARGSHTEPRPQCATGSRRRIARSHQAAQQALAAAEGARRPGQVETIADAPSRLKRER